MVTTNELLLLASNVQVDDEFLEHFGKKGMKWGARRTARTQGRLDRTHRLATGKGSMKDKLLRGTFTKKGAHNALQRGANNQAKVAAGKGFITKLMTKKEKTRLSQLDFHKTGDAKAKLNRGQKAAIGLAAGLTFASIVGRR